MSVAAEHVPRDDLHGPGKLPLRTKSETADSTAGVNTPLSSNPLAIPDTQTVLLLHATRQPYVLQDGYPVPASQHDREVLVRNRAIGLNPMDWKAPDFNFGIPVLPYISGRELAGEVVDPGQSSRFQSGDKVIVISTDYRDLRKAAYQQYAISLDYNTVRLPPHLSFEEGATLGVAFVVAALSIGVNMGLDFSHVHDGPDLYTLLRSLPPESIPADVREECLGNLEEGDRARPGDWVAVWGASSTSANLILQLARLAGLRTMAIADTAKHGLRLSHHPSLKPDLLVDSHDPARAVDIIRATNGNGNGTGGLRFGIDTRGRDSAAWLMRALDDTIPHVEVDQPPSPPSTPDRNRNDKPTPPTTLPPSTIPQTKTAPKKSHLIGLTGLPNPPFPPPYQNDNTPNFHTIPIKLFHDLPALGEALVLWLERLLAHGLIAPADIIDIQQGGLGSVNAGLNRMRGGEISGGKLVVRVE
ncbi:chaperonin 10-like protein [Dichotomopilus funicola]|uniref:Chaperonin 10-like protein n=1 Tax=Dichotomopilus funicola TaxID=1934379 RepID=A0AAN6UXI6_9PEZI|nr:chaperonin 10-like protein [Dichotomopilus funicola]